MAAVSRGPGATAKLVEAFVSLQGEGERVGERQVFVRFATCDRHCAYCDTPESIGGAPKRYKVSTTPGVAPGEERPNPVTGATLDALIDELADGVPAPVVSLTGGEPLLHVEFLSRWMPEASRLYAFHLETHGLAPGPLARVLPWLTGVSLDLKLESATGEPADWEAHHRCLDLVRPSPATLTVKAVVGAGTRPDELAAILGACRRVAGRPGTVFVLQPVSPWPGGPPPPSPAQLLGWQRTALLEGIPMRVIPQVHRLMDLP